jgi:hypothetical protein
MKFQWTKSVTRPQIRRLVVAVTSLDDGCCENHEELTEEDLENLNVESMQELLAVVRERDTLKDRVNLLELTATPWLNKPLPEDDEIIAAFPTRSNRHDLYQEAVRLVGARSSKASLVALVTWLLLRIEKAKG